MTAADFPFLSGSIEDDASNPLWTGNGYKVGSNTVEVLRYPVSDSAWSDELTGLHEDEAEGGRHFIDVASRKEALNTVRSELNEIKNPTILEVGVSSGYFIVDLHEALPNATILGADYTYKNLSALAKRYPDIPFIQTDIRKPQLPGNSIDAIILINVLEHVDDHKEAIENCFRMLKSSGIIYIEVPAGPHLYDAYDKELMHFRRYLLEDISSLVERAGFTIKRRSHLGFVLFPFFRRAKLANRKKYGTELPADRSVVQQSISYSSTYHFVGSTLMALEALVGKVVKYPVGIRCIITAQKTAR